MTRSDRESYFDELDEQIRAALIVETSSQQLNRLEEFWQRQSHAEHRRRRWRHVTAMAAAILIVLTASLPLWHGPSVVAPHEDTLVDADRVKANEVTPQHTANDPIEQRVLLAARARPATTFERFVFASRVLEREISEQTAALDGLETAISRLASDRDANPQQLLEAVGLKTVNAERLLLRKLDRSNDQRKLAIVRLLAECGTSRSTSKLLKLSRHPALRQEALKTIERSVGIEGLTKAATQTNDPRVRASIYQRLLADAAALDAYLTLVRNEVLHDEVLAVADEVPEPVLDALLNRLNAEDRETRLSAALVLGHANGPHVTNALITLVSEHPTSPTEVWIALMACRGSRADQFLAYATRRPQLLGPFNRARMYWARTIH